MSSAPPRSRPLSASGEAPPIPAGAPVVHASGLDKRFGERHILRNASLCLHAGESTALLGESGAGKSTLLNMLAGLEPADGGVLEVVGHDLRQTPFDADRTARMRREAIGFAFQAFHLLPHISVWQNVALPLLLNGASPDEARPPVRQMLQRLGLEARHDARPAELSGGEQQRVCLARALIHRPRLLLADEPTGNLDPPTAAQALRLLQEVVAESGCAMLMVTHSTQAAAICSRHLRLAAGRIETLTDP